MAEPSVPRNLNNPVGQTDRISRATRAVTEALDGLEDWLMDRLNAIPVDVVTVNARRYEYQISILELERLVAEMIVETGRVPSQTVINETLAAYQQGTGLAASNLANLTDDYRRTLTQILLSDPYQRRAALVGARVFEEMRGFTADTGRNLARILRQAVQDSLPPLQVAEEIEKTFNISRSRAETIARTEITGALRRGRWDEAQDARDRLGIRSGLLWISALKPTTRLWHAQRMAEVYTIEQVREFYATAGNAINCYCTQTEILLDADGEPISTRAIKRLTKAKRDYLGE